MSEPLRGAWARWRYAAKPASWPKLLVPAALGQALGISASGTVDLRALGLGMAFCVALLLFVVFWNDFFDRRVDRIKREMFPRGCSPKTIPDAILPASALFVAGAVSGGAALVVASWAGAELGRSHALAGAAACLAIFVGYSVPPVRINARGGGEWLETFGVGLALPLYQAYLQAGRGPASLEGLWLLPGLLLLARASAIASGLSDERSDRRGGKVTFTTKYGNAAARRACERLVSWGALAWAVGTRLALPQLPAWAGFLAVLVVLTNWRRMRAASAAADTDAFAAQARYKQCLHHALWRGGAILGVGLVSGLLWGARG